jgi:NADPH:quinone reductase-like Zn-dependent oxidoreductase
MNSEKDIPESFEGIGYTKVRDGFPLEAIRVPVPRPAADQVLIRSAYSSLNPLEYKLADLNFFGRTPPVILGFDLAGTVLAVGEEVTDFVVGDPVAAMADSNGDGGWATGGRGGYAVAREFNTIKRPASVSLSQAAALPLCFIAAHLGLANRVHEGDIVYIPGGGGGVGHLAVQIASRIMGATVISSGGTPQSIALARASGADHVFNYKTDDIKAEMHELTGGRGVDAVYDITYSEQSFIATAELVREGGSWIVLGVGPGRTSRTVQTESPVDAILSSRRVSPVNVNMLRYFSEPTLMDDEAKSSFRSILRSAMAWAAEGRVVPHIDREIDSSVDSINAALGDMRQGTAPVGKIVVRVDHSAEAAS